MLSATMRKTILRTNTALLVPSHSQFIGNILAQEEAISLFSSSSLVSLSTSSSTLVPVTGCLFGRKLNSITITKRTHRMLH